MIPRITVSGQVGANGIRANDSKQYRGEARRIAKRLDDLEDSFDTLTLVEVWPTAPYLHDGRYVTIKEMLLTGEAACKPAG